MTTTQYTWSYKCCWTSFSIFFSIFQSFHGDKSQDVETLDLMKIGGNAHLYANTEYRFLPPQGPLYPP